MVQCVTNPVPYAAICDTSKPNSSFTELPLPPGRFSGSVGDAVNNGGDVVGSCWLLRLHIQRRHQHGPEYAIPANSGWDLSKATDINDNGTIVGSGFLHGKKRGFVLMAMVPTPGLSSLSKLIEVFGRVIGSQTVDGSGIIFLGGIPHPVGP